MWNPIRGETVAVCDDGKKSRAVTGEVLQSRGNFIQVRFQEWGNDPNNGIIIKWFPRLSHGGFGAYCKSPSGCEWGFSPKGDWYSVYPCVES